MNRKGEGVHQSNEINQVIHFVRENDLVREIGNKPVITDKGLQFLNDLQPSAVEPVQTSGGV